MNSLRKYLGILWMILGPLTIILLINAAYQNIDLHGKGDINKPIPWIIVIAIFAPICAGLVTFGWYAWKGEYD